MKNKVLSGLLSLALGLFAISCDDNDDYSVAKGTIVTETTTGSADVTANSAVLHGTVKGIESQSSAAYAVGIKFGTSADNLSDNVGSLDGNTITVTKLNLTTNTTYYYQAYITLQGKVTYTGEVKSLVTTNAQVTTKATTGGMMKAVLGGTITDYPTGSNISCGIVISMSAETEAVRAGLIVANPEVTGDFSLEQKGLLPGKTYYYAAYLNLGSGIVYGNIESFSTEAKDMDVDNDFVNLGLSKRWAKFNLGASTETENGGLFAYGDLTGVNNSTTVADYGQASDIYLTDFDICQAVYPKSTLPTADDFAELFNSCTYVWTTIDGVSGYEFTGPNGNKLCLPAAGSRTGNDVSGQGTLGNYLTGSINSSNKDFCQSFAFGNGFAGKDVSPRNIALAVRPVLNVKYDFYTAKLTCYGSPENQDDAWASATTPIKPVAGNQYTITFNGQPRTNGKVYVLDIPTFSQYYPNAFVRIDDIQADGVSIKYDANKFFYGDIENKGTYRVELANIWGKGHNASWDGLADSPFSNTGATTNETNLAFTSTFAVTFTIVSLDMNLDFAVKQTAVGLATGFAMPGNWENLQESANVKVSFTDNKYSLTSTNPHSITYNTTEAIPNGAVNLVEIMNLCTYFPKADVELTKVICDGNGVSFNADKIKHGDIEGKGNYRIELHNIWGSGTAADPAFGNVEVVEGNNCVKDLGFATSTTYVFSVNSLFEVPVW